MKILLIISIIFSTIALNAQEFLKYDYDYIFDWEAAQIPNIKLSELENLYPTIEHLPWHDFETAKKNIDKYHLLDTNNDGIPEIIYNGYSGSEGEMVIIINKSGQEYNIIQEFFGRIVNISQKNKKYVLSVLDYSCCGGYVDHIQYFEYDDYSERFLIQKDIAKLEFMHFEVKSITPVKFKVVNDEYNLRFNPEIKNNINPSNYPFDPINNSNISAIYKKDETGIAIAESIDSTGRIWWLVIMDSKPSSNESLFYEGNNSYFDYKPIGWMSSRYLEIIQPTANKRYM